MLNAAYMPYILHLLLLQTLILICIIREVVLLVHLGGFFTFSVFIAQKYLYVYKLNSSSSKLIWIWSIKAGNDQLWCIFLKDLTFLEFDESLFGCENKA